MCGIAGIVAIGTDDCLDQRVGKMIEVQAHRGPNGRGKLKASINNSVHVALGHLRLAILDLTEAGRQPMVSPDGRHIIIYNGEIYNYKEIQTELEALGISFRTRCDTEVVLQALIQWGREALPRFNGMWALAWLDREAGTLLLSRDRFGIKPLYYFSDDSHFYFASEIKGILAAAERRFEVNKAVVCRYLQQSVFDAQPETFFVGIRRLPPGHNLWLDLKTSPSAPPDPQPFWKVQEDVPEVDEAEYRHKIRETFLDAVRLRLRSDVPVGVLLSGGLDSSSIATAMREVLGTQADLHILSAVSDDSRFDESVHINRMAAYLGVEANKIPLRLSPGEAYEMLPLVSWFNDEPVGSFSNVAHFRLMEQARQRGITVILSGQGGDEILCGYKKYLGFYLQSLTRQGHWLKAAQVAGQFYRQRTVLPQFRFQEAKRYLPKILVRKPIDIRGPLLLTEDSLLDVGLGSRGVVDRQMADLYHFSVPALVHYEDRMSMAWSREIRLPFLDYRLVNMLLPLAPEWKLRNGWTKWIFRKALEEYLPSEIAWRKDKLGFALPESEWLRNQLRGRIQALVEGEMLTAEAGWLNRNAVQRLHSDFCRQAEGTGWISFKDVFHILALEAWARKFEGYLTFD